MQANHLRPARRPFANLLRRPRQIFFLIRSAAHLHQSHGKFIAHTINPITNIFLFSPLSLLFNVGAALGRLLGLLFSSTSVRFLRVLSVNSSLVLLCALSISAFCFLPPSRPSTFSPLSPIRFSLSPFLFSLPSYYI